MTLTSKQQVFVSEYLACWNASEAARRAGYNGRSNTIGNRLLSNVDIAAEIKKRIDEKAMTADEVLLRLAEQARADMADFVRIMPRGLAMIDLRKAKRLGKTHLIKKFKVTKTGPEIELHDPQAALIQLGRHHGLFTDKLEISWRDKLPPNTNPDEVIRQFAGLLALAAQKQNASDD